jgi:hypothetical protein
MRASACGQPSTANRQSILVCQEITVWLHRVAWRRFTSVRREKVPSNPAAAGGSHRRALERTASLRMHIEAFQHIARLRIDLDQTERTQNGVGRGDIAMANDIRKSEPPQRSDRWAPAHSEPCGDDSGDNGRAFGMAARSPGASTVPTAIVWTSSRESFSGPGLLTVKSFRSAGSRSGILA